MTKDTGLIFEPTKRENIRQAKAPDGSKMVIAAFEKGNGKTIAMLDFKDVPGHKERAVIQKHLKEMLEEMVK